MKVNEGVIDGHDVHFARIKSSPGDQAPDAAESEEDKRREGVRGRGRLPGTEAAPGSLTLFQRRGHSAAPKVSRELTLFFLSNPASPQSEGSQVIRHKDVPTPQSLAIC